MDKETLNQYVENKELFRKAIKDCKSNKELYEFLMELGSVGGFKLYVPNKWGIPVEEVEIVEKGSISCYFYMTGKRRYKTIEGLAKVVELIKCDYSYDKTSVWYYNVEFEIDAVIATEERGFYDER